MLPDLNRVIVMAPRAHRRKGAARGAAGMTAPAVNIVSGGTRPVPLANETDCRACGQPVVLVAILDVDGHVARYVPCAPSSRGVFALRCWGRHWVATSAAAGRGRYVVHWVVCDGLRAEIARAGIPGHGEAERRADGRWR